MAKLPRRSRDPEPTPADRAAEVRFWAAVRELAGTERAAKAELDYRHDPVHPDYRYELRVPDLEPVKANDHGALLAGLRHALAEERGTTNDPVAEEPDREAPELPNPTGPNGGISHHDTLEANGYAHIREQVAAVVGPAAGLPVGALDAALDFVARKRKGPEPLPPAVADAMDVDTWRMEAVRDFVIALAEVGKRAQARATLRGQMSYGWLAGGIEPAPPDVGLALELAERPYDTVYLSVDETRGMAGIMVEAGDLFAEFEISLYLIYDPYVELDDVVGRGLDRELERHAHRTGPHG